MMSRFVLSGLTVLLSGCFMEMGDSNRYHEDFHHSYKFNPGGRLAVENENGTIEISTWEKDEIEINGTKNASRQEMLQEIKIDIDSSPSALRVKVDRPNFHCNCGVRFAIRVPKKLELERIKSTNGGIQVTGIEGNGNLTTTNGRIEAMNHTGKLTIETTNGSIELSGHKGDVRARTSNGKISGELAKGIIDAHTTNGGIDLKLNAMDSSEPVRLETTNGNINLTMATAHEVRARTSNSSITVKLPGSIDANLRARTSNSRVDSEFGTGGRNSEDDDDDDHGRNRNRHKTLDAKVGKGGPVIDLSTSNGRIRFLKS
jgi:DUF4097 and DUF4098 domain-containing protein YvlB